MIPVVESDRLVMRGFVDADLDEYARWLGDVDTARYIGGKTLDRAESWRSMAMMNGHWTLRGYGMWAVTTKDGALVGRVGLWNPEGWPGVEVGWLVAPEQRGKGYAQEAAKAAIAWGRERLGLTRILSVIHVDNAASIRTAVALGEARLEEREIRGFPCALYGMDL